jgi:hypothetical protein
VELFVACPSFVMFILFAVLEFVQFLLALSA